MAAAELLRIVALCRGKLKAAEFRLREGENGISLFARADHPAPAEVLEAVRSVGKQGELAIAVIDASVFLALGLRLVNTPGGTGVVAVDDLHCEARIPWLRRLLLRLRGIPPHEDFNERCSAALCAAARLLR